MSSILKFALGAVIAITGVTAFSGDTTAPQVAPATVQQVVTKESTSAPTPTKPTPTPTPSTYKEPVKSPYQAPVPTESVRTYTNYSRKYSSAPYTMILDLQERLHNVGMDHIASARVGVGRALTMEV